MFRASKVSIFLLLSAVFATCLLGAADAVERTSRRQAPTMRLHRRENPYASRYTPFAPTPEQWRLIEVYEFWAFLNVQCLCARARKKALKMSRSGKATLEDVKLAILALGDDQQAVNDCTKFGFDKITENADWVAILVADYTPEEEFMAKYHNQYRHNTEWCLCVGNLLRDDNAPLLSPEDERTQRLDCAAKAREKLEPLLRQAPPTVPLAQQPPASDDAWLTDMRFSAAPGAAGRFAAPASTQLPTPAARGLRRLLPSSSSSSSSSALISWSSAKLQLQQLRATMAERRSELSSAVASMPGYLMRVVPQEIKRRLGAGGGAGAGGGHPSTPLRLAPIGRL